jgi:UDP-2-acetamido-2-deoxy-ribo-hexuluronate aminotransferase
VGLIRFNDLVASHARYADAVDLRIRRVFAHGKFIMGPEVEELEAALASFVGVPHAVTVKSGTLALELALRALGIGPGDEVITSPFSWISAAEAIMLVGARPVFVDIEESTFLLDVALIEGAITPHTKAIVPVSLFGQLPALEAINAIAERYGLAVIEDGAQSFGASRHGQRSCSMTTIGVTSFFPSKPLGGYGDGGALFTRDAALARKLRLLRGHGAERRGEHVAVGLNGRLDTLQAAVLLAKLPQLDADLERRRLLAASYTRGLSGPLTAPLTLPGNVHVFGQYTIRVTGDRDTFAVRLREAGVESAVYYATPLHLQPVFRALAGPRQPRAESAAASVLSLPLYPAMAEEEVHVTLRALATLAGASTSGC